MKTTSKVIKSDIDELYEHGEQLIEYYRAHPVIAAYDLLNVDLAPVQRIVFRDMWFKNYVIAICGRGGGKTYMLGANAVLHALLYPGYRVGLIAPGFRQSKLIFSEVEKLYDSSPIFREASERKPTRGADTCFIRFKGTETTAGSYIEALPIGTDGAKIRGSRFHLIEIDELAQMPSVIIDRVIRPFGAVSLAPMKKVRRIEEIRRLIELGLATEDDLIEDSANKMVMTSSGYFKFNHMWKRMKSYWRVMNKEGPKSKYSVLQVPYTLLPEGFLDQENIQEAKRTMSSIEFSMEYEAAMVSDSAGFFKASVIEACSINSGVELKQVGDKGKEYVVGIDPNQGGNALCGITVIECGKPNKIVFIRGLKKKTIQDICKYVQDLCTKFNVIRIFMDSQGGGNAVKNLLEEGYGNKVPILDITDDRTLRMEGNRILHMVNPTSSWISDGNFDLLSLLENRDLLFPELDQEGNDLLETWYDDVKLLKSQLLNIMVTQTPSGVRHFDTPKKGQNKDLYSALVLSAWGVRELNRAVEEPSIILNAFGYVRPHSPGAKFNAGLPVGNNKFTGALLKKL